MNKKILWGMVGALILTGGYYASAASSPLHYTDYGYTPVTVSTTTYAPGTPSQYEYPNSPYQIGGRLGPKSGQTWQQKFDAGTVANHRTTTPTSPSKQSTQTAMSSKTSTPQRTTVQAAATNTSVAPTSQTTDMTPQASAVQSAAVDHSSAPTNSASSMPQPSTTSTNPMPSGLGGYMMTALGGAQGWVPDNWQPTHPAALPTNLSKLAVVGAQWNGPNGGGVGISPQQFEPNMLLRVTFANNLASLENAGGDPNNVLYSSEVSLSVLTRIAHSISRPNHIWYSLYEVNPANSGYKWMEVSVMVPFAQANSGWWVLLDSWIHYPSAQTMPAL